MYATLLHTHNFMRWAVLILLVAAIIRALVRRDHYVGGGKKLVLLAMIVTHIQFVIGLLLYMQSPHVKSAFANFGAAMGNTHLRFWALEHPLGNIIAIALITIGYVRAKKAVSANVAWKRILVFYSLALLVLLLTIPWPWAAVQRPLFPGMPL